VSDPDLGPHLALGMSHRGAAQAACQMRALLLGNRRLQNCVILNSNLDYE